MSLDESAHFYDTAPRAVAAPLPKNPPLVQFSDMRAELRMILRRARRGSPAVTPQDIPRIARLLDQAESL